MDGVYHRVEQAIRPLVTPGQLPWSHFGSHCRHTVRNRKPIGDAQIHPQDGACPRPSRGGRSRSHTVCAFTPIHPSRSSRSPKVRTVSSGWRPPTDCTASTDSITTRSQLPFLSARFVAFTRDGSLWCGDFEGLTRARNSRFEIVLKEEVFNMAAYPDQLFVRLSRDLAQIGLDGSVRMLNHRTRRDLTIDSSGRLWSICIEPKRACWIDPSRPEELHSVELPAVDLGISQARSATRRDGSGPPIANMPCCSKTAGRF